MSEGRRPRVAHWVHDLIRGGTEGQCSRVAIGLAGRGWDQRVLCFHRDGFFLKRVDEACGGAREVKIRHAARFGTLTELIRTARWLQQEKVELLHTWDADAAVFGQFVARWAGIPLVTSRRDLGDIYPNWKVRLLRRADAKARKIVVNALAIRDHFGQLGVSGEKMVHIPNILDIAERDAEAAAAPEIPHNAPAGIDWAPGGEWRLAIVNRLDPEKNTRLLVEALAEVVRRHPQARLWVIGDGQERAMLETLARETGVAQQTIFWGERHDVASILKHVQAGALVPKANEGLSNTILEYMAASKTVLATDCGGNRELVEDGVNGRLLPLLPDAYEVAEAWSGLIDSSETSAWGQVGRRKVEQRYAPDAVLPQFERLYMDVLGR